MPRPNQPRSIGSEALLADRIAYERVRRGLTYEALASAMTETGCHIDKSAIYRIEKGSPRRKVSVDELVALIAVLGVSFEDLMTPLELVQKRRAHELIDVIGDLSRSMGDLASGAFNAFSELIGLAFDDDELFEYVVNQLDASPRGAYNLEVNSDGSPERERIAALTVLRMVKANRDHWRELQKATLMWESFKAGRWTESDDKRAAELLQQLNAELDVSATEGV